MKEWWNNLQLMNNSHPNGNFKVCPECRTNLINTARHCVACGYTFTDVELQAQVDAGRPREAFVQPGLRHMTVTINLPLLVGAIILLLTINTLVILGFQKRDETKILVAAEQVTATYVATTFMSPTPSPTSTPTPGPPTPTPLVYIEYTVVSGDSCLSIADHFNIYLDSLLAKNEIDCAVLNVGTVLRIPPPAPTPEATSTGAASGMP